MSKTRSVSFYFVPTGGSKLFTCGGGKFDNGSNDETIDDVILRLARWIISEKATSHYIQLGRNIEYIDN